MNLSSTNDHMELIWRLAFVATPFALALIGLAMTANLARIQNYRILEQALRRSPCLKTATEIWSNKSFHSRMSIVSTLTGIALHPKFFLKRKLLDETDASSFPYYLKVRMRISFWLLMTSLLWLTIAATLIKLNYL